MNKFKRIFCVMFRHSRIISMCFGYVHCGRCEDQIGDTLGGIFDRTNSVIVGHGCRKCKSNYKKLSWKDKFLVKYPFKKKKKKK